jgi:hypothetical protein
MNAQEHLFPVTMGQLLERRNIEIPLLRFSANYREAMGDTTTADLCRQHLALLDLPLETLTDDQLHDAFSLTGLQYIVRAA